MLVRLSLLTILLGISAGALVALLASYSPAAETLVFAGKLSAQLPADVVKERPRGKALPEFTPEREAAALTFVGLHHPEVAELLKHLKEHNPREYQKAIRELYRTSDNLAQTKELDLRRYELDLRAWQLKSRIQLLMARLTMGRTKALEAELRKALAEQIDVRRQQQELLRERTAARLKEIDAQLANINQDVDEQVEQGLQSILASIAGKTDAKGPAGKDKPKAEPAAGHTDKPEKDKADRAAKPRPTTAPARQP